jgi:hypothetical protein
MDCDPAAVMGRYGLLVAPVPLCDKDEVPFEFGLLQEYTFGHSAITRIVSHEGQRKPKPEFCGGEVGVDQVLT